MTDQETNNCRGDIFCEVDGHLEKSYRKGAWVYLHVKFTDKEKEYVRMRKNA